MGQIAQNLRDMLALARMLRRHAGLHLLDRNHSRFLATAAELEERAHLLATTGEAAPANGERAAALHAPVDLRV
jgi:hypothetical protein